MKTPCKKCGQSGVYVDAPNYTHQNTYTLIPNITSNVVACKFCNGAGWIDDDEIISVPRKYVSNEYFNK